MSEIVEQEWKASINPWVTLIPVMIAVFMYALDETISNVALPYMAGSFSISNNESTWIITSYLVASGIVIPAVDFFCKLMGRKAYFILSIVIFTMSSILCGLSTSMPMMLFARIMQGIGGGGIMPISQAIIFEIFPPEKRSISMAIFGLGVIMAPIIGPALGGWITDTWSWPFIYFINIPFGIAAYFLIQKYVEEPPYSKKQKGVSFDYSGFFFLALWLLTLQIVLDKGNDSDWFGAAWICKTFAVSMISFFIFIFIQMRKEKPLVDLSIFRDNNFLFGTIGSVVMMGILMSSAAILPSMLQNLMGYTSFLSGLSMIPRGAGCFLASIICGVLAPKLGNKTIILVGLTVLATGGLMFGEINTQISLIDIGIPNFVFGVGMIMAMVPIMNASCSTLKNEQQTNAAGVQNLLKNTGAAIGTSIATTAISRFSQAHQMMMVGHLNFSNNVYVAKMSALVSNFAVSADISTATQMAQRQLYNQLLQQATLWGYIETFRYFAVAAMFIVPFIFFLNEKQRAS
jgi:DHA2 family multidrug resistance protein